MSYEAVRTTLVQILLTLAKTLKARLITLFFQKKKEKRLLDQSLLSCRFVSQ